jgi:hypothetical protein
MTGKQIGYECTTNKTYMLRNVRRGNIDKKSSCFQDRTDFVQHGQLALLTQAFPMFFQELNVGLNLTSGAGRKTQQLLKDGYIGIY